MTQIGVMAAQGMVFQATRLAVAASNIVNARASAPATAEGQTLGALYAPRTVQGVSVAGGGVRAEIAAVNPASFLSFDPASPTGFSALPNVDLANEIVTMMMASSSYKAAARVLAVESELSGRLAEILA